MQFPPELEYSKDHEWIRFKGERARIGITDFAQIELGDIVYVEVPETGKEVEAGEVFGSIEAVKTVSDLFMPLPGTILELNPLLKERPELINTDPYGDGWIVEIIPSSLTENGDLMDAEAYRKMLGEGR